MAPEVEEGDGGLVDVDDPHVRGQERQHLLRKLLSQHQGSIRVHEVGGVEHLPVAHTVDVP